MQALKPILKLFFIASLMPEHPFSALPKPIHLPFPSLPESPILLIIPQLPICSMAKVMYCWCLMPCSQKKLKDESGILFVYFPVNQLADALSQCEMTVRRSLNELAIQKMPSKIKSYLIWKGDLISDSFEPEIVQGKSKNAAAFSLSASAGWVRQSFSCSEKRRCAKQKTTCYAGDFYG